MTGLLMHLLGAFYGLLLGSGFASFILVVSERVPAGESINGRSHCVCGRQLKVRENVPIAGWLAVGGRARCCGAKLPARYLAWEIVSGVFGAVVVALLWRDFIDGHLRLTDVLEGLVTLTLWFSGVAVLTWQQRPERPQDSPSGE